VNPRMIDFCTLVALGQSATLASSLLDPCGLYRFGDYPLELSAFVSKVHFSGLGISHLE